MKQPTRISNGSVRVPVSTQILLDYVRDRNSVSLSVPATAVAGRFLFDIRSYLGTLGMEIPIQAKIVMNIANLFKKYETILGSPLLQSDDKGQHTVFDISRISGSPALDYLKSIFDSDQLQQLLSEAYTGIRRSLVRGSLADAILLSTLADESAVIQSLSLQPTSITIDTIQQAMSSMQSINSQILTAKDLGSISMALQSILSDPFFSVVSALKSVFQERKAPSVIVMRNEVEDQILPLFGFKSDIVQSKTSINGLLERVTEVDKSLDDVPRVAFMASYMRIIRMWMGVPWSDPFTSLTLQEMMTTAYAGNVPLPAILEDFGNSELLRHPLEEYDMDTVAAYFCRRVAIHLIRAVSSGEPGILKGKYMSLLDNRAYKKADIYSYIIERTFDLLSYTHSAMCSALADLGHIAFSDTLYFPYEKPWKTRLMKDFFNLWLSKYKEHRLSADNLREILEPANILTTGTDDAEFAPPPMFYFDDTVTSDYSNLKYDAVADRYFSYFGSIAPKQGVITDAPVDLPPSVITRHTQYFSSKKPLYMMQVPYAGSGGFPLDSPYSELLIRSISPKSIVSEKLQGYFESLSQYLFYTNYQDLMQAWNIDERTAAVLWGNMAHSRNDRFESVVYLRFTAPLKRTVVWDPSVAPIYEIGPEPEYENMVPYVDVYPAICYIETDGFMNDSALRDLMVSKAIVPRDGVGIPNSQRQAPTTVAEDSASDTEGGDGPNTEQPSTTVETPITSTVAPQPATDPAATPTVPSSVHAPSESNQALPDENSVPEQPEENQTAKPRRRSKRKVEDTDENKDN